MPPFKLSLQSLNRLSNVHPDLVGVVKRAIELSSVDFMVTEGARAVDRQAKLVKAGASKTMKSRHLVGADGFAKAVDLAAVVGREARWDWPLYINIAGAMKQAAKELGVPLEWGGDWRTFKDGPHFQLPKSTHP